MGHIYNCMYIPVTALPNGKRLLHCIATDFYSLEERYVQSPKSKRVLKLLEMQLKQLKMALDLKTLVRKNVFSH